MPYVRYPIAALAAAITLTLLAPLADARTATKVQTGARKIGTLAPSINANALVAQLAGTGVTLSNARFTGSAKAVGSFGGAASSIGIDSGVVLSTGDILDLQGPNDNDSTSTTLDTPGDNDLALLVAPYATYDAAILEFDLVTASPTISIRYVFASEEYNEYVDSPFNDVMAIYVNGVNCANTGGQPVAVNTINAGRNSALYFDNTNGARNTQMDGMTVPLDCTAAVNVNQVNKIRIAIADVSDPILDSAVFLAAGGVRSPGVGSVTLSNSVKAIEYYHAGFDHYFMTAIPAEIAILDTGVPEKPSMSTSRV
ncbi:MAG: choice-of-anchor L domain-containing protein [Betaproteobacteria bacterium]